MEMITIEELMPEHFELVASWLSKGEINRWLTSQWRNRVVTATLIAMVVRDRKNRLFLVRCESLPCGLTALAEIDTAGGTAMVWSVLGEQTVFGRGIGADAVRQLMQLWLAQMRVASVT